MSNHLSILENPPITKPISLLGIPIDIGKDNEGTDAAPDYLRKNGLLGMFEFLNMNDVKDLGNVPCPKRENCLVGDPQAKYAKDIITVAETVAPLVAAEIAANRTVVALGGDHSMSFGTIAGASVATNGDLGVIWIDAHGDMNVYETTRSGNVHGMPSSAAIGFGHLDLVNIFQPGAKVKPANMVYLGHKDLDQPEINLIREKKLTSITMFNILEAGLAPAITAINGLTKRVKNIWVSLDLDSIDVEYAPGTPMATPGGFTYREITTLCKYIGRTVPVVGMDIAEFSPRHDRNDQTNKLAIELVANLLGNDYGWYVRYMEHEEGKKKQLEK